MNIRTLQLGCLALLASHALCACEEVVPTTQIVMVLQAEEAVRDEIRTLELETAYGLVQLPRQGEVLAFPLSFSLVPASEELMGNLTVRARGEQGEVLITRELGLAFRSRRTLSYGVLLGAECEGIRHCPANETCDGCGRCVPVDVLPEALVPLRHAADAIDTWQPVLSCDAASADGGLGQP